MIFYVSFKAGETHEAGKGRHPGNDGAAPAVVAQKRRRPTAGARGGRLHGRGRPVVVLFAVFVGRGAHGGRRAKVPDGVPGVRGRGEPVRRPAGRRGRGHQEAADVAPGLLRGQNEVRAATAAAAAAAAERPPVSAAGAAATRRGGGGFDVGRRSPAAAGRASPGERVHGGATRPANGRGRRPAAVRGVLRRAGRVVHQLVGRRRGRRHRGRGSQEWAAVGLLDEEARDGDQETPGRHPGQRSYGRRPVVVAQDVHRGASVPRRRSGGSDPKTGRRSRSRAARRRSRIGPEHVETVVMFTENRVTN